MVQKREKFETKAGRFTPVICKNCKGMVWHLRKKNGQSLILTAPTSDNPLHSCFSIGRGVPKPPRTDCDDLFDVDPDVGPVDSA
ncbi:hypothetical protein NHF45_05805 [Maricaulaceae bacterium NA33B04]|nr:hypothetical protein [Maricaulaceae bacterium NA33B04]